MVRAAINQRTQVGLETMPGTTVPGNKSIDCFQFDFGIEADVKFRKGTGKKYAATQELNREWGSGSMSGDMDYNGVLYPLSSAVGLTTPSAVSGSSIAKLWNFVPVLSGNANPATYTFEKGDSTTAERWSYGLFQSWGYKGDPTGVTTDGTLIAQKTTKGVTLTASPTVLPLIPMHGSSVDIFMDPTFAQLGTTKIAKPLSYEFAFGNIYDVAWYVNTSNASFAEHVDDDPTAVFKMLMVADTNGMTPLDHLRVGDMLYIRVKSTGQLLDNLQTVSLGGATAGTFTLTYKGQTTSAIAYNAAASAVQTALQALSTVGAGNALVTGSAGGPYTVSFTGTLAQDTTALTGAGAGLTGGTFAVTQSQVYNSFTHDMAVKVDKPDKWSISNKIYAIMWNFQVMDDSTAGGWGKAHQIQVVNSLTSL